MCSRGKREIACRARARLASAYLRSFHFVMPSFSSCKTAGPVSVSASSHGSFVSGWKGARHSIVSSSLKSMQKRGYGRLVKLLL